MSSFGPELLIGIREGREEKLTVALHFQKARADLVMFRFRRYTRTERWLDENPHGSVLSPLLFSLYTRSQCPCSLSTGIPQGSVLVPLLFSLYPRSLGSIIHSQGGSTTARQITLNKFCLFHGLNPRLKLDSLLVCWTSPSGHTT